MSVDTIAFITIGALTGGFVSGLAGFGTGLVALGIWLHAVPPLTATALVVICSVAAQLQTIGTVWHAIQWRRVLPFVGPGLIGVPIGARLIVYIEPNAFRFGVGVLLLCFSTFLLICGARLKVAWGGRFADAIVGLAAGVLGGLSGLSGPLPTLWASVRGWEKDERRSLFQVFNLTILLATLLSFAVSGRLTADVGGATLVALPGTILGAWVGSRAYRRLSTIHFQTIILGLLAFSGLTLVSAGW